MGRLSKKTCRIWKDHLSSSTPAITYQGLHWLGISIMSGGANIMIKQAVVAIVVGPVASEEAPRRYYSTKYFFANGAPNVFSTAFPFPQPDSKFFDNNPLFPPTNLWLRYSNEPLRNSLEHIDQYGRNLSIFL